MPKYAVTIQGDFAPVGNVRRTRAERPHKDRRVEVSAPTIDDVTEKLGDIGHSRIVAIEEMPAWRTERVSDEALFDVLTSDDFGDGLDPDDFEDHHDLSSSLDVTDTISDIQRLLNQSDLVPGLEVSLIHTPGMGVDAVMVEIHDPTTQTYRAKFSEIDALFLETPACGWRGVLSLARGIMVTAEELM